MRRFAVDVVGSGGPGLTRSLPADDGATGPTAVIPSTAAERASLPLNSARVTGPRVPDDSQRPDQSTGDNDHADEQPAHEPQAQTDADPDAEPEAEEPETDAEADLQADPQARGEAFDLQAGDGGPVWAPHGEEDESRQAAGGPRTSPVGCSEIEEESKSAGAKADSGADSGTGGRAARRRTHQAKPSQPGSARSLESHSTAGVSQEPRGVPDPAQRPPVSRRSTMAEEPPPSRRMAVSLPSARNRSWT